MDRHPPGTDGLFVMALIHELLQAGAIDNEYLARYTNAPWLVIQDPGAADDGLFARGEGRSRWCWTSRERTGVGQDSIETAPALAGEVSLPDGRAASAPRFNMWRNAISGAEYAPDAVAETAAWTPRHDPPDRRGIGPRSVPGDHRTAMPWTDWAGRRHETMIGRPVAMHAMRGISAHSNGFHTCRAVHLLQVLLGSIDVPGGFRYKPPFPKPVPPGLKPAGKRGEVASPRCRCRARRSAFRQAPEDLLVDADGGPLRIDKAYSWEHPIAAHGLMQMVIHNAWKGDPYPVDVLMMFMANMSWNSSMNSKGTIDMLTDTDPETGEYKIPKIIYSDAYYSEMVRLRRFDPARHDVPGTLGLHFAAGPPDL
jgi:anaerobic selenocysteine-containing dehydrogenase